MLRAGRRILAAVWVQHVGHRVGDLHVHAAREVRGHWLTPATLRFLAHSLRSSGYRVIRADPRTPFLVSLVQRLGFEPRDDGAFYLPLYDR